MQPTLTTLAPAFPCLATIFSVVPEYSCRSEHPHALVLTKRACSVDSQVPGTPGGAYHSTVESINPMISSVAHILKSTMGVERSLSVTQSAPLKTSLHMTQSEPKCSALIKPKLGWEAQWELNGGGVGWVRPECTVYTGMNISNNK